MWRRSSASPGRRGAVILSPFARRGPRFSLSPFRPFQLWGGRHFAPLAGVAIGLAIFLISQARPVQVFEGRTLDMRFLHRGTRQVASPLAVVFIDDEAIQAFGRWPWSWDYHALLVDVLKRHGARDVIFDVVFAEAPSQADVRIFSLAVKAAGNVYLTSFFNRLDRNTIPGLPSEGLKLTEPVAPLKEAAKGLGHCNAIPDHDGITRRVPLLVRYSDGYYPSAALRVTLDQMGVPLKSLEIRQGESIRVPLPAGGHFDIPMDEEGQTLVNFAGGLSSFEQYSFLQVLQSDQYPDQAVVDLGKLQGKTVLVGVTFSGNTDLRPTPFSPAYPMLCILGNAVDNIVQRDFMRRESLIGRLASAVLLGALAGLLCYVLRPFFSLSAAALMMAGTVWFSVWRFEAGQVWVDLVAPTGIILASYLAMTTVQYIQNRREKMQYIEYLKYTNDLVESTNDAIVGFDLEGKISTWNSGAERIFGWKAREALGKGCNLLASPADLERLEAALVETSASGQPQSHEITGLRRGSVEFPASFSLSQVQDSRGEMVGISCISQDLTEKKRMVEMLVQSEKMAELGRLGSGIVHEIKNPLTSIMMLTGMVLAQKNLDPKAEKYIAIIDQESQRILRLTQNILSFARPKKPEMKAVELNKVIEETLSLVEYELKRNKALLKPSLADGGVVAFGDEEKLKQVFLNLIINAVHAMEGGGTLEIATGLAEGPLPPLPEELGAQGVGEAPSPCAWASVRDEGCGIRREIMEKIFEPFFTTKAEGKGTGLGLYISRNIIMEHRGNLTVASRPGSGTVFRIALPVPPPAAPPAAAPGP